jgi:hypothetical protein
MVFFTRRVGKNRYSRCDTTLHQVRGFQSSRASGIKRYDDDLGWRDRFVADEQPSCGSQNRLPDRGNSNDDSRGQCDRR